jgi:hypothetical protein
LPWPKLTRAKGGALASEAFIAFEDALKPAAEAGAALIGSVLLPAAAIGLVEFGTYAIFVHGEIANRIKKRLAANKH